MKFWTIIHSYLLRSSEYYCPSFSFFSCFNHINVCNHMFTLCLFQSKNLKEKSIYCVNGKCVYSNFFLQGFLWKLVQWYLFLLKYQTFFFFVSNSYDYFYFFQVKKRKVISVSTLTVYDYRDTLDAEYSIWVIQIRHYNTSKTTN